MKPAVFLERDGILTLTRVERGQQVSPRTFDDFSINPAAQEPLARLKQAGFLLLATTNQPGLSRGYLSRRELDLMHMVLRKRLPLDDILMCPHDEMDRCPCRKPQAGLLLEAAFQYKLDMDRCFVVSDKWQDAKAAHIAGCTSMLLKSRWNGTGHVDFVLPDLDAIVTRILRLHASPFVIGQEMAVKAA